MAILSADEFFKGSSPAKAKVVSAPQPAQQSPQEGGYFSRVKNDIVSGVKGAVNAEKASASGQMNPIYAGFNIAKNLSTAAASPLTEAPGFKQLGEEFNKVGQAAVDTKIGNKVTDSLANNFSPETLGATSDVIETGLNVAAIEGMVRGGSNTVGRLKGQISDVNAAGSGAVSNLVKTTIDSIDNIKRRFSQPDVNEATKVSLNPTKALEGTGQDIQVSVGGKVKNLSEITPTENMRIQNSTAKSLENFTKQAELFSKDRSVKGGSPVEIVGERVDKALSFADKKRQFIGQKMGDIESQYVDTSLPISEEVIAPFVEVIKNFDNPKYGVSTADAPVIRKLVEDFDKLESGGATIGERLDFIRSWDKYLNDARDSFGKFKENATVNTRIQNAIRALKEETVAEIAKQNKTYRSLRSQYREYKSLDEIGNKLLGKDGATGGRIKGAATVKRAIQSNSDAGARQFLIKLQELTGYDAIKEGDLALTAMESVGDYQGLSLLNVLREGKTGLLNRALEMGQDLIVGDKKTRVKNYVEVKPKR